VGKNKTHFVCQECGTIAPKWLGRCPGCGAWNSMVEELIKVQGPSRNKNNPHGSPGTLAKPITEIEMQGEERSPTGCNELDRVLGGGLVPGSTVLVGGDPGIGKSTLLLSAGAKLARCGQKVLYVSGEESEKQIRLRAERIDACSDSLYLASEVDLDSVLSLIEEFGAGTVVVDSIQTVSYAELSSAPGSVSQVRESAARLVRAAKETPCALLMVGHVTKEGGLAGPRVLEHMVDAVLYFEGERGHPYRILRAVKNRYGSTNEIGLFEMTGLGLREVDNPSEMFLTQRPESTSGSTVLAAMEGTRPLLVEIQALVIAPSGMGVPRRTCLGMDPNRIALLLAVLEKKAGLAIAASDVFVNVAGGIRLVEPAADLASALSMASSFLDKPLQKGTAVFGEVGLAGEVRAVSRADSRISEAEKLGFKQVILPLGNLNRMEKVTPDLELIGVENLDETLESVF